MKIIFRRKEDFSLHVQSIIVLRRKIGGHNLKIGNPSRCISAFEVWSCWLLVCLFFYGHIFYYYLTLGACKFLIMTKRRCNTPEVFYCASVSFYLCLGCCCSNHWLPFLLLAAVPGDLLSGWNSGTAGTFLPTESGGAGGWRGSLDGYRDLSCHRWWFWSKVPIIYNYKRCFLPRNLAWANHYPDRKQRFTRMWNQFISAYVSR